MDQLCWHPKNPDMLVTASGDKTVRLWDARNNKAVATVNTKGNISTGQIDMFIVYLVFFIPYFLYTGKNFSQFPFEMILY